MHSGNSYPVSWTRLLERFHRNNARARWKAYHERHFRSFILCTLHHFFSFVENIARILERTV